MTRINCVPVMDLSDKHLGAEYRELPRVFGLVHAAILRGERPDDPRNPNEYRLGAGHVRFFYPRLRYLQRRYKQICWECKRRGRKVGFPDLPKYKIPRAWFGDWVPDHDAQKINRARLKERGG